MKKAKNNPWLSTVMICLMTALLLVSALWPDPQYSYTENRPLARSADFSLSALASGKTGKDLNSWFSDQMPGRNLFFHMDYLLRKLSGQREIKDVFLGKGALLANPEAEKDSTVGINLDAVNLFTKASGIPGYLMVVPSAATIQPQKLPASAPVRDVSGPLDYIAASVDGPENVDIRSVLSSHKDEYIYYRTDHHWTSRGAGYGAEALMEAMGYHDMNLDAFRIMPVSFSFEGTLASKTGSVFLKDEIDIAAADQNPEYLVTWADGSRTTSIYDESALAKKDQYQVFLSNNQGRIRIDTTADTDRSLLLFKDSYANSVIQYLLPYFSSITIIDPRYYYEDLNTILDTEQFTDCAFLFSYDTFAAIQSLADLINGWAETTHPELLHPETAGEEEQAADESASENESAAGKGSADEIQGEEPDSTQDEEPADQVVEQENPVNPQEDSSEPDQP